MRNRALSILVGTVAAISACTESVPTDTPDTPSLQTTDVARSPTYDDRLAAIADRVPGFAGMFYDSTGQLVTRLKDAGRLSQARDEVHGFLVRGRTDDDGAIRAKVDQMRSEPADYSFRELLTWYRQLPSTVFGGFGITAGDIDEIRNRIVLGVDDSTQFPAIRTALARLNISREAVVLTFAPEQVQNSIAPTTMVDDHLQQSVRPYINGVQIDIGGAGGECTLGYTVWRPQDANWYFITAAHCTGTIGFVGGGAWGQPNTTSGSIGYEVADPPTFTNAQDPQCPVGENCRYSDVALFRTTNINFTHARVAWPAITWWHPLTFTTRKIVKWFGDPIVGLTVYKVGRTTGRTSGTVTRTCYDVINTADNVAKLCQAEANYAAGGGDSGSPVVYIHPDGSLVATGVHWGAAGSLVYFSMSNEWFFEMIADFGGSYDVTELPPPPPPPSLSVTINGPSQVESNWFCEWTSTVSGGTPPYSYSWSGVLSGSGSTVFGNVSSSGQLLLSVTDAGSASGSDSHTITVQGSAPPAGCFE